MKKQKTLKRGKGKGENYIERWVKRIFNIFPGEKVILKVVWNGKWA